MSFQEPLAELFSKSKLMILDFKDISHNADPVENIQVFFEVSEAQGHNPRLPQYRQTFNNRLLEKTGMRYLVSRYGEDRSAMLAGSQIAREGRTLHMGIDIFSKDLEPVYAPCNGTIVRTGFEDEAHSYGHYIVLKPEPFNGIYLFFGHLSAILPPIGTVVSGEHIATLGDYIDNENGGWSRHLHLQCLRKLPDEGQTPIGYASQLSFAEQERNFPSPFALFPDWHLN